MATTAQHRRIVSRSAWLELSRMVVPAEIAITGATSTRLDGLPSTMYVRPKKTMAVNGIECQTGRAPIKRAAVVMITDTLSISACVGVNNHNVTIFGTRKSGQVESVMSHPAAMEVLKPNESARPHSKVAANNSVAPMANASGPSSTSPEGVQLSRMEGNQRGLGSAKVLPNPLTKSLPRPKNTSERR